MPRTGGGSWISMVGGYGKFLEIGPERKSVGVGKGVAGGGGGVI